MLATTVTCLTLSVILGGWNLLWAAINLVNTFRRLRGRLGPLLGIAGGVALVLVSAALWPLDAQRESLISALLAIGSILIGARALTKTRS